MERMKFEKSREFMVPNDSIERREPKISKELNILSSLITLISIGALSLCVFLDL